MSTVLVADQLERHGDVLAGGAGGQIDRYGEHLAQRVENVLACLPAVASRADGARDSGDGCGSPPLLVALVDDREADRVWALGSPPQRLVELQVCAVLAAVVIECEGGLPPGEQRARGRELSGVPGRSRF
jgi:hypothetical protein